jgi:hypothetical protein
MTLERRRFHNASQSNWRANFPNFHLNSLIISGLKIRFWSMTAVPVVDGCCGYQEVSGNTTPGGHFPSVKISQVIQDE